MIKTRVFNIMVNQIVLTILLATSFLIFPFDNSFATTMFYLLPDDGQQRIDCDYVEIKNDQIICTDNNLLIIFDLDRIKNMVVTYDGNSYEVRSFTQETIFKINDINSKKINSKKSGEQGKSEQAKYTFLESDMIQQLSFDSFPDFVESLKNKFQIGNSTLSMILLGSGFVVFLIGSIGYLVATFRVGILWGLSCLLLPFISLIFLFVHWKVAAKPFFVSMLGVAIAFSGTLLVPTDGKTLNINSSHPVSIVKKEKIDGRYKCSGKIYCSEMTSCAEAKFYLRNCPGTKMDGDNDGIPCEKQWCGNL